MLFGKRRPKEDAEQEAVGEHGEEVIESAKTKHGRFTIIPRAKQLVNGHWIARITLEEELTGGSRSYDFSGPMTEYESRDDAVKHGVEHAKRRIDDAFDE